MFTFLWGLCTRARVDLGLVSSSSSSPPPPPQTADLLEAAQATLDARGVAANCNNNNNNTDDDDEEVQMILKQIDLDVDRTMPGHKLFDVGQEGGIKLRRILVAYSVHVNREIGEWG